jgi:hypothetical protein
MVEIRGLSLVLLAERFLDPALEDRARGLEDVFPVGHQGDCSGSAEFGPKGTLI